MQLVMNLFLPCSVLFALSREAAAVSLDGAVHQLRRSDKANQIPIEIPGAEEKNSKGQRTMDAIKKFRAEICYKMKKEHGIEFASFEACEKFMNDACEPGKDKKMDGDRKEVTSGEGYCQEYFPEAEKKAKAKVEKEDEDAKKPKVLTIAPGPSPFPAPAPAPQKKAPAPAPVVAAGAVPAPAPSPGPMSMPAPAPVPAPFIPGVSGGKPYGAIADDEAYYYKKGGKDPSRMHMNEGMKLPTQGYWGKLVEHEDQKTATGDWGKEFGPGSDKSFEAICAKNPDNPWCYQQGYGRHRSSCPAVAAHLLPLVFAFVAIRAF